MRRTIAAVVVVLLALFTRGKLSSVAAEALLGLGCLIIVGFALARLLEEAHLPRATGYVAAGILLGPHVADLVRDPGGALGAVGMVFVGWVGFCAGSRIRLGTACLNTRLVQIGVLSVLAPVLLTTLAWSSLFPAMYIAFLVAVAAMLPDPFWAFASTGERQKRTREGVLRTLSIVGMATACVCWAVVVGAIRRFDGASLCGALAPFGQLVLSVAAGVVWGELVYHLCGVLRSRSAVLALFLVSVLGVSIGARIYPVSLLVSAVSGGIWTANRGTRSESVLAAINPVGYIMAGPLFAVFGTQIPAAGILSRAVWPLALVYLGGMVAARMGAGLVVARVLKAPGASGRYLSWGALLQGIVLLEMVRWTQAALSESPTFRAVSEDFATLGAVGMLAGSVLLPLCTYWAWHTRKGR